MASENLDSVACRITEIVDYHAADFGIGADVNPHPLIHRNAGVALTAAASLFAHSPYCAGCAKIVSESRVWERSNFGRF